ncbi:hypothetical protein HMPREF9371_2383 [Neisseria shayeganii 871]|uniref:Uncharacterized protein n=1 Tax=Neisseria shayeganii 871 TaxID=1032488 RepID=G4CL92_9NEIS|nr:hypothetical protein HMPREF9371_2383 [Neisseria shayeganii 871]
MTETHTKRLPENFQVAFFHVPRPSFSVRPLEHGGRFKIA